MDPPILSALVLILAPTSPGSIPVGVLVARG